MKLRLTSRYFRNENGSLSVEACFAVPLLAWAICATYVFFDAFKTLNVAQKATYTIVDMISREEVAVDDNYITALHETFQYLSGGQALGPSAIRVSVVEMTEDPDTGDEVLELIWSEGRNYDDLDNLDPIRDLIPGIAPGEQLVVVESVQQWTPAFGVGLATYNFRETALSRPRFAPKICWETTAGCTTPSATPPGGSSDDGTI
ncbi:MAG: hypothetical protein AAF230_02325 [Pseudomonadota bacterium]